MTKPRVTTADRLSNIIEVVELGRRSGLLTVERGSLPALEQGEVFFSQGRAVYAAVEGLLGPDALSALAGWGTCRFAFDPSAPRPQPNIITQMAPPASGSMPGATGSMGMGGAARGTGYAPQQQPAPPPAPRGGPATFNWDNPANRQPSDPMAPGPYPNAAPGQSRGMPTGGSAPGSMTPSTPSSPSSSFGASWPAEWPNNPPTSARMPTGQLNWPSQTSMTPSAPPIGPTPSQSTGPFSGGSQSGALRQPGSLERRPRRSPDVRDLMSVVSAHNLSRNHRTILLLADGEHTILDIARLSSKPVDEVVALLTDLERAGLVY